MVIEAVAIDGPVASGKTSVGVCVADRLNYAFLDTGIMYRAATWQALRSGVSVAEETDLTLMAESMHIALQQSNGSDRLLLDGSDITDHLRDTEVDRNVSAVSAVTGVRQALIPHQRRVARAGPIVMVGRDIGTVVLPDARTKVYLDASVDVRARRRHTELLASGVTHVLEQVIADTVRRDRIDSERGALSVSKEAVVIQTDNLDLEGVVERIVNLVERR